MITLVNRSAVLLPALAFILAAAIEGRSTQTDRPSAPASIKWTNCLAQTPDWYAGDEAIRIAENVLLYQRNTGGWPKNIDMALPLTEREKRDLTKEKQNRDSTIDNGATYTQIAYLVRVFEAKRFVRHRDAALAGIDYMLAAQYENGGWPQYYPDLSGYYKHITFNDDAMIGVMKVLRDIAERRTIYGFVDENRRRRAAEAVRKGIDCILKAQVLVQGKRTVWCAQHDEVTFAPANARTYELASLSGGESVAIVRFLMGIENPSAQVVEAIQSAIAWFRRSTITGISVVDAPNRSQQRGRDKVVIQDPKGEPLWARFYEIGTNRPLFVGRNGIAKYRLADIEAERRNNYRWYVTSPAALLKEDHPAWEKKWAPRRMSSTQKAAYASLTNSPWIKSIGRFLRCNRLAPTAYSHVQAGSRSWIFEAPSGDSSNDSHTSYIGVRIARSDSQQNFFGRISCATAKDREKVEVRIHTVIDH
jgi:PelA/Pel-15E family pectate lyase